MRSVDSTNSSSSAPGVQRTSANVARMGRGGGLNLIGAVCSQLSLFAIISMLARLGEQDVGRYASCFALLSLLGLLSLAGFRSALTRFVAIHVADGDARRLHGTLRLGLGLTVVASSLIGIGLALAAPWTAGVLKDPELEGLIRLVGLTLPAATFTDAALAATQGWRTQRPFTLIGRIFEPLLRLGLTVLALALGWGIRGAVLALVAGAWLTAGFAAVALARQMRGTPRERPLYEVREIFGFSMVSWISALAATGLIWVSTLMLGAFRDQAEVGSYNVATRLVMLAVFVMAPINASFTPHMAHLYHTGEMSEAARAYGSATRWILTLSLPAFILLIAFPRELLGYFGEAFAEAAMVTVILSIGQLVSAAAGPCGTVLNMSGRVALNMVDNVGVLVLNIVLNVFLIDRYGAVGAAIAWSMSLVVVNIAKALQARRVVGVRPAGAGVARAVAAAVPAAALAWLLGRWVDGWVSVLLIAAPAVAVVFFGTVALMGLSADDRAILQSLRRRLGPRH